MFFTRYGNGLKRNRNYFRWTEYSLSSSVMIWLVAQITGITDVAALFSIFAVNASMIMFGALQEKYESPGSGGFLPFIFGSMTGVVPWIVDSDLLFLSWLPVHGGSPRLRRGHYRFPVLLFQYFCRQPGFAVPPGRQLG